MIATLNDELAKHGIHLPPERVDLLDRYREALWEKNQVLNLTRHTDLQTFVVRDVVDSIKLAELLIPDERILDVGSGGGVPAVVMAILRPDVRITCSESVGKKAQALAQMIESNGLAVDVHAGRAEQLLEHQMFDSLTARGVGPLSKLLRWFAPHWSQVGRFLLIKGPKWIEERGAARHLGLMRELDLRRVQSYRVADTGAESVILEIRPKRRD